jgi:hypothetical protein
MPLLFGILHYFWCVANRETFEASPVYRRMVMHFSHCFLYRRNNSEKANGKDKRQTARASG